jgi:hypothetical protein
MPHPVLDAPISPLRQRLIDDMTMRRFSQETQRNYIRDVGRFASFLGRSPFGMVLGLANPSFVRLLRLMDDKRFRALLVLIVG